MLNNQASSIASETEYQKAINNLTTCTEELGCRILQLRDRLKPILKVQEDNDKVPAVSPSQAILLQNIDDRADKINEMISTINEIINCLVI